MTLLLVEIQADIDWRISELSTIKTIPFRYKMSEYHVNRLMLYSIPSIYAIWEGFLKTNLSYYAAFINQKNLKCEDLDINIITHNIDNQYQLRDGRVNFDKQKKLVSKIMEIIQTNPVNIDLKTPKMSNFDYKTTNKILERYNLPPLNIKYKKPLESLLDFRNAISHGENARIVEKKHLEAFTLLIGDLMLEILLKIENSVKNERYKCN